VETLVRTANGPFRVESASEISAEALADKVIPLSECLPFLPRTEIRSSALTRVRNGASFTDEDCISGDLHNAVYNIIFDNSLLAMAERQDGVFRVLDGFGGAE
jgi:tRNA U55 pseudouridine synthase TruB